MLVVRTQIPLASLVCLLGCMLSGVTLGEDAAPILLQFKFTEGQELVYDTKTESQMVTRFEETEEEVENSTESRKRFKVLKVQPSGAGDLEVTLDSVKMRAQVADNDPEEFDSSKEEEVERTDFRKIKESVGKPQAVLRFGANGKLMEIVNIQVEDIQPHPDEFQTMLMLLPAEPVKVGSEWSEPFKVRVGTEDGKLTQEIALSRKYKVESIEGDLVKISLRTVVLTPIRSNYIAVQLSQREMKGEVVFDNKLGMILSRNLNVTKEIVNGLGEKTLFKASTTYREELAKGEASLDENPESK